MLADELSQALGVPVDNIRQVRCESCGCDNFDHTSKLLYVSPLCSKSGQSEFLPLSIMLCNKCGTEVDQHNPNTMKLEDGILSTEKNQGSNIENIDFKH